MTRFTFTGRLVQGDAHKMFPVTDNKTKQPKLNRDGSPRHQAFVALAIPKAPNARLVIPGNPSYEEQKALLDAAAKAAWPNYFTGQRAPGLQYAANLAPDCTKPDFANKVIDGDGYDSDGQPFANNEGWAGCWVVKCSNGFAPKVYSWTASGWQETVHSGVTIKCGDYVTVSGTCVSNRSSDSPGMYMNFDTVAFEQEGQFIASASSVDPNAALGQRGAPAIPPAHAPAGTPPAPAAAPAATAGAPAPGTPSAPTAPAYSGYREEPAAPPAPAGPQMTAAAQFTYDQYKASGWSDDQLRANGLMA